MTPMRVHIGSDHAGYELKTHLVEVLTADGHEVVDHGAPTYDALDDYPEFCIPAAEAVAQEPDSLGIVLGGSGNGENIAANKVRGVRSVLAWKTEIAQLGREHNGANVVAVGARMHSTDEATAIVRAFLATDYPAEERHARRIQMLTDYENR